MKTKLFFATLVLTLIAGPAFTALPPGATTLAASQVTLSQATLNGVVSPDALATSAYFNFGTTTNYGSTSATVNYSAGYYPPSATGIAFNGVNQNAAVPGFGNYAPTNEVTIEFWQKAVDAQQQSTFILTPDIAANRFNTHQPWIDGNAYWDFGNIGGSGRLSYAPGGLVGVWNHIALVASQSGNSMSIYRNGVLEAQKTGMTPFQEYSADLLLAGGTSENVFFNGALAEFRVWNKALDQSTIQTWLNRPLDSTHPAWTNLVAYWPMNEGSGNVLNDQSGHGHTAYLTNAPAWIAITNSQISATVTGLSTQTTYHYQLIASNVNGVTLGKDVVFSTPAAPPPSGAITWSAPVAINGDSDVYNVGAEVYAYDWANVIATVNGVTFFGTGTVNGSTNVSTTLTATDSTAFNSYSAPFNYLLRPAYKSMLIGGAYDTASNDTVTLSNLVVGHPYAVQVWVNDPRGGAVLDGRAETLSSPGGNSVTLNFSTNGGTLDGVPGQFTIGTFTASSSIETFTVQANSNGVAQLNALQLRDLTLAGVTAHNATPLLYSLFGPGYSYLYGIESRYVANAFYIAMPFKPNTTAILGRVIVPVYNVFTPNQIRFTLCNDNNGVPGASLETWSLTQLNYGSLTPFKSVNFPTLTNGVQYWLVASADDPNTQSYWWLAYSGGANPSYNLSSTRSGPYVERRTSPELRFRGRWGQPDHQWHGRNQHEPDDCRRQRHCRPQLRDAHGHQSGRPGASLAAGGDKSAELRR